MQSMRSLRRSCFSFLAILACAPAASLFGCSSSTETVAQPGPATSEPTDPAAEETNEGATPPPPAADKCVAAPKKSRCKNESSWIRGVAHFDPSHFKAGAKPVLRVVLRHSFALMREEATIGGRLHAFTSVPIADPSKGEVPFAIDMCSSGAAMWSEENGGFHVVLILDEDGNNDLDDATDEETAMIAAMPGPKELVKLVDVDVSCKAPSPCLDVKIDCTGSSCTTIQPMTSCKKKATSCESDSSFCR
jgi:hypothetical protein